MFNDETLLRIGEITCNAGFLITLIFVGWAIISGADLVIGLVEAHRERRAYVKANPPLTQEEINEFVRLRSQLMREQYDNMMKQSHDACGG